ncbi:MAG: sigma-70 family RNA polymerase sigma factor [Bacteroidota bacterium]
MSQLAEWVQGVRKKDLHAMKQVYNAAAKGMLNLSYRITLNLEESQDIIQESFMTSFQSIHTLENAENYFGWLKRIVINNSLKAKRKQQFYESLDELEIAEEEMESDHYGVPFPEIQKAITQLPDGCREIFCLYAMEDYKHREIAEMLDVSISTSKSQYRYALKLMRSFLTPFRKES